MDIKTSGIWLRPEPRMQLLALLTNSHILAYLLENLLPYYGSGAGQLRKMLGTMHRTIWHESKQKGQYPGNRKSHCGEALEQKVHRPSTQLDCLPFVSNFTFSICMDCGCALSIREE